MRRAVVLLVCAAALCLLLCGCDIRGHDDYGRVNYGYDSRLYDFLDGYDLSEIVDYLSDRASLGEIIKEIGRDELFEYFDEHGWIDDWIAEHG